jgi:hypothetical protein
VRTYRFEIFRWLTALRLSPAIKDRFLIESGSELDEPRKMPFFRLMPVYQAEAAWKKSRSGAFFGSDVRSKSVNTSLRRLFSNQLVSVGWLLCVKPFRVPLPVMSLSPGCHVPDTVCLGSDRQGLREQRQHHATGLHRAKSDRGWQLF